MYHTRLTYSDTDIVTETPATAGTWSKKSIG